MAWRLRRAERSEAVSGLEWASVTNADLLLSVEVPVGWDIDVVDDLRFRVYAERPDADAYRASVGFVLGEPEEPGSEWFARFCAAVPETLARSVEAFELISTERFGLSSGADVFVVRARQHAAGAPATSQVLAYIWANSYRMYVMDAATMRAHEDRDFPVFDRILRSLRVLPPRV
jgi:hypothetical protein